MSKSTYSLPNGQVMISCLVPLQLKAKLKEIAQRRDRSVSYIMRDATRALIQKYESGEMNLEVS